MLKFTPSTSLDQFPHKEQSKILNPELTISYMKNYSALKAPGNHFWIQLFTITFNEVQSKP